MGDEVFHLRFAEEIRRRGAIVSYRPEPRLDAILERSQIVDKLIADDDEVRARAEDKLKNGLPEKE